MGEATIKVLLSAFKIMPVWSCQIWIVDMSIICGCVRTVPLGEDPLHSLVVQLRLRAVGESVAAGCLFVSLDPGSPHL